MLYALCPMLINVYFAGMTVPVPGVQVSVKSKSAISGVDGYYEIHNLPEGNQVLTASKEGFDDLSLKFALNDSVVELNVEMTSAVYTHNLHGTITSKTSGSGIENCKVSVLNPDGTESQLVSSTDANGYYLVPAVPEGNWTLCLSQKCHLVAQVQVAGSDYQFDAEFETEMTDDRDGKVYAVVEIGGQIWMAENLNYGERIDGMQDQADNQVIEKYCYEDNEASCDTFGGLYQWDEMMQYSHLQGTQGICPDGWHLPAYDEWTTLVDYLGGAAAGGKLKLPGMSYWFIPNTNATNESGFTALPAGALNIDREFFGKGSLTGFWSSSEGTIDDNETWIRVLVYNNDSVLHISVDKTTGNPVRCVRD